MPNSLKTRIKKLAYQNVISDKDRDRIINALDVAEQEPKFIAKSDGTIEQIKNCDDCLFKKEWEKIGKLVSVVLEKQTEQEPQTDRNIISRTELLKHTHIEYDDDGVGHRVVYVEDVESLPSVNHQDTKTDYRSFAEWVASEVIDEDNWEWNSGAFPEVACRKLNKLGVVDTDGKRWIYEDESIEQEPKTGHWITEIKSDLRGDMWPTNPKCSKCGGEPYYSNTIYNYKFCPYCGARMEG